MQDGTTVQLAPRRKITFTATPDEYGRCVYQVQGVGAFTLEPSPYDGQPDTARVVYGRVEGNSPWFSTRHLPDRPVVCRVQLEGACCFNPVNAKPTSPHWLTVYRDNGNIQAPDGTRRRTAEIVHALVQDWLARDDHAELISYHRWHLAPGRMSTHAANIKRLNVRVADLLRELAEEHAGYAEQAAIRNQEPITPGHVPDPANPDGQAILRLREHLALIREEHRYLPGGEVVPLVEKWLADLNVPLTAD
ncbi:hypothetical protein ACQSSU_20565 [Micromonospora echinospora]